MKEKSRARRIRDLERMKAKCRRVYPYDIHAKSANHLQVCSCRGCGHYRKWEGPKISELKGIGPSDPLSEFIEFIPV